MLLVTSPHVLSEPGARRTRRRSSIRRANAHGVGYGNPLAALGCAHRDEPPAGAYPAQLRGDKKVLLLLHGSVCYQMMPLKLVMRSVCLFQFCKVVFDPGDFCYFYISLARVFHLSRSALVLGPLSNCSRSWPPSGT